MMVQVHQSNNRVFTAHEIMHEIKQGWHNITITGVGAPIRIRLQNMQSFQTSHTCSHSLAPCCRHQSFANGSALCSLPPQPYAFDQATLDEEVHMELPHDFMNHDGETNYILRPKVCMG